MHIHSNSATIWATMSAAFVEHYNKIGDTIDKVNTHIVSYD